VKLGILEYIDYQCIVKYQVSYSFEYIDV
jgi:hypothetical protein